MLRCCHSRAPATHRSPSRQRRGVVCFAQPQQLLDRIIRSRFVHLFCLGRGRNRWGVQRCIESCCAVIPFTADASRTAAMQPMKDVQTFIQANPSRPPPSSAMGRSLALPGFSCLRPDAGNDCKGRRVGQDHIRSHMARKTDLTRSRVQLFEHLDRNRLAHCKVEVGEVAHVDFAAIG